MKHDSKNYIRSDDCHPCSLCDDFGGIRLVLGEAVAKERETLTILLRS